MTKKELGLMQNRIAELSIGPSVLRGRGTKGLAKLVRQFLKELRLGQLRGKDRDQFGRWLDLQTRQLTAGMPARCRSWGRARKALNIFLRNALYNRYLSNGYSLSAVEQYLEVPLDSYVGNALGAEPEESDLPKWSSVNGLTAQMSGEFQAVACRVAVRKRIAPVHLDLYYFRK